MQSYFSHAPISRIPKKSPPEYQDGFASGDKQRELRMEAAYRIGVAAVYSDEGDDAFNHPDAQGPCRIQWTQAYNRGHFQGKTERTAAIQ